MFRIGLAVLALSSVSSSALAQRGGGGRTFGKTPDADYGALRTTGVRLSTGDIEEMNPIKRLVDKRKDLKLTEEQQKQLRSLVDQMKEANKPRFKELDSMRAESRPRVDADVTVEQVRTGLVREQMRAVAEAIRGTYASMLPNALAVLDAVQQAQAAEHLKKQAAEAEEILREKLGGGRGGSAGGRGGPPV